MAVDLDYDDAVRCPACGSGFVHLAAHAANGRRAVTLHGLCEGCGAQVRLDVTQRQGRSVLSVAATTVAMTASSGRGPRS